MFDSPAATTHACNYITPSLTDISKLEQTPAITFMHHTSYVLCTIQMLL